MSWSGCGSRRSDVEASEWKTAGKGAAGAEEEAGLNFCEA
jgi:hypothetical protein